MIIKPRVRGFICVTAHPVGCEANVKEQIDYVTKNGVIEGGPKKVLVLGASTGYGLAARISAAFGCGADTLGVFFEKEGEEGKLSSAGWYNSAAFEKFAVEKGLYAKSINGDAFSDEIKRLTIETIKENQESELINNPDYGLLAQVTDEQRIFPLTGAPTPDDLDELLTKVWKEPAFFLTHPLAIAAFGREATRRGTPPPTISLFGSQFITWRGIPLIPSDKVPVADGKSKILLLRVGDKRQGVVGLYQPGLPGEQSPGLSVRFMGINSHAISSYLISLYCSLAVLTPDALAVLDDVEIGKYHDYPDTYK